MSRLYYVNSVILHLFWFPLVTISWWDDLWLNEGFASYMEYKGVQACEPDWDIVNIVRFVVVIVVAATVYISRSIIYLNHRKRKSSATTFS